MLALWEAFELVVEVEPVVRQAPPPSTPIAPDKPPVPTEDPSPARLSKQATIIGVVSSVIVVFLCGVVFLQLMFVFSNTELGTYLSSNDSVPPTIELLYEQFETPEPITVTPTNAVQNRENDTLSTNTLATPTKEATSTNTPEPTATPVPSSLVALVDVNVQSGPGFNYDLLGLLPSQATAGIIGQDETRQWWQISFAPTDSGLGWVLAELTEASNTQNVPIVLAPPTPTPASTNTPEPTATRQLLPNTPTPIPQWDYQQAELFRSPTEANILSIVVAILRGMMEAGSPTCEWLVLTRMDWSPNQSQAPIITLVRHQRIPA